MSYYNDIVMPRLGLTSLCSIAVCAHFYSLQYTSTHKLYGTKQLSRCLYSTVCNSDDNQLITSN